VRHDLDFLYLFNGQRRAFICRILWDLGGVGFVQGQGGFNDRLKIPYDSSLLILSKEDANAIR
jgi:hypothetical protein